MVGTKGEGQLNRTDNPKPKRKEIGACHVYCRIRKLRRVRHQVMALCQVMLTCGLPDIENIDGKRPTQAFINSQGFADIDDFAILAVKDAPYMIKNHNSIHDQSVILGSVHQIRIQALIYWAKDQK